MSRFTRCFAATGTAAALSLGLLAAAPASASVAPSAALTSSAQQATPASTVTVASTTAAKKPKPTECSGKIVKNGRQDIYIQKGKKKVRVAEHVVYYSKKSGGTDCAKVNLLKPYRGLPKAERPVTGVLICKGKNSCSGKPVSDQGEYKYSSGPVSVSRINGKDVYTVGWVGFTKKGQPLRGFGTTDFQLKGGKVTEK